MRDMGSGNEFYEDDEPVNNIVQAFDEGEKEITASPERGQTTYLDLGGVGIIGFLQQSDNDAVGSLVRH
jgi:hypothetical protein